MKRDGLAGVSSGLNDLDKLLGGFHPSDLVILAARPSMGKTTFSMNIAEYAAIKHQCPVAIFSMEMPGEHLALRMMSSLGHIDQHKIRTGKQMGFWSTTGDKAESDYKTMKAKVMDEVKRVFNPEFLNRLDETVIFNSLTREHIRAIADIQLRRVSARVAEGLARAARDESHELVDALRERAKRGDAFYS